jgi:RNA polymerase-associated protein LEO1
MNVIKVSNIMGIDPKPFDPKTYVEEDVFVTDESGTKKKDTTGGQYCAVENR